MIWKFDRHVRGRGATDSSAAMVSGDTASTTLHKSNDKSSVAELLKVMNMMNVIEIILIEYVIQNPHRL